MARDMHREGRGWLWLVLGVVAAVACGPIAPEQPPPNRPPYIHPDRVRPERSVVEVDELSGGSLQLEVTELLDPNDENRLFYVWIGDERGIQQVQEASPLSTTRINGDRYHTFQSVELQLDPCEVVSSGTRKETIWLYVSDRRFATVTTDRVVPRSNAYVVSRTWVLEYSPQLCTQ
jgi:hypothetical protein